MMKDIAQSFAPGSSAQLLLVRKATVEKVLDGLKPFVAKGKLFKTSLSADDEAALRAAMSAA